MDIKFCQDYLIDTYGRGDVKMDLNTFKDYIKSLSDIYREEWGPDLVPSFLSMIRPRTNLVRTTPTGTLEWAFLNDHDLNLGDFTNKFSVPQVHQDSISLLEPLLGKMELASGTTYSFKKEFVPVPSSLAEKMHLQGVKGLDPVYSVYVTGYFDPVLKAPLNTKAFTLVFLPYAGAEAGVIYSTYNTRMSHQNKMTPFVGRVYDASSLHVLDMRVQASRELYSALQSYSTRTTKKDYKRLADEANVPWSYVLLYLFYREFQFRIMDFKDYPTQNLNIMFDKFSPSDPYDPDRFRYHRAPSLLNHKIQARHLDFKQPKSLWQMAVYVATGQGL